MKDFYILIQYGDSDFRREFEHLGEYFCKEWNDNIKFYNKTYESVIDEHCKNIKKLEKTIINALVGSYILLNAEYEKDCIDVNDFTSYMNICKEVVSNSIQILTDTEYKNISNELEGAENLVIEFKNNCFSYTIL